MLTSPRASLYKNDGRSPAAFRESLRKKCLDRLREGRIDRQNSRRGLRFDTEVKQALQNTIQEEMGCASFEEQMAMMESLENEIIREFEEYEAQQAEEEQYLADHLDPDAFCPACKRNPMEVDHTGCLCRTCGFGYQFRSTSLTKQKLAETLLGIFQVHGEACLNVPDPLASPNGLFIVCDSCKFSQLIVH